MLHPALLCLCRHTNQTGVPIMRPLWYEFPDKTELFSVDDEFMLGPGMLVKPITHVSPGHCCD
jgi:alpha-glucosidase (family GH31 glycosyl hydrolase)